MKRIIGLKSFDEFILESSSIQHLKFYVDMDGVLADFNGEIKNSEVGNKVEELMTEVRSWMVNNYPDRKWRTLHDISDLKEENKDFSKLYDKISVIIKTEARKSGFFRRLKVISGAFDIISSVTEVSGKLPTILTACIGSPYCESEKIDWLKEHFPGMYEGVIFEQKKEKYANENSVLIDDREKNVEDFSRAGGIVIHAYDNDPKRTVKMINGLK